MVVDYTGHSAARETTWGTTGLQAFSQRPERPLEKVAADVSRSNSTPTGVKIPGTVRASPSPGGEGPGALPLN